VSDWPVNTRRHIESLPIPQQESAGNTPTADSAKNKTYTAKEFDHTE
jgi:hypothetical protein